MRRLVVNAACAALSLALAAVGSATEMPAAEGLGEGPNARLSMHFEVTFMKIDVADIEAWLANPTASRVSEILATEKDRGDARDLVAEAVLDADTMLVSMQYSRDSDHGRLMKGVRNGFEAAMKSDLIDEETMERMYEEMAPLFDPLEERGVLRGDRLVYRLDGVDLRILYVDPEGATLVEGTYSGPDWAIGMKGAFFGEESRFRKKLVTSIVDRES